MVTDFTPQKNKRGSVLVLALMLILVSAAAITKFSERAISELAGEGYYVQRERLRGEAFSALEATLAALNDFTEIDEALFSPAQGWGDPLAYTGYEPRDGVSISVQFEDENARLPLKSILESDFPLVTFFTELDFEPNSISIVVDSLSDWIDEDESPRPYGAESNEYAKMDPPHKSPNRLPRSFDEFEAIQGFADLMFDADQLPNENFEAFRARFSLFSNGKVNLNSAPESVLRLTGDFDDAMLGGMARALDTLDGPRGTAGGRFYTTIGDLANAAGIQIPSANRYTMQTDILAIIITVKEGEAIYRLRAVVKSGGTRAEREKAQQGAASSTKTGQIALEYPFTFLELTEDPPPTAASIDPHN